MFGFIAEYTGKAVAYMVDAGEAVVDDTVSMYDEFSKGYSSVRPDKPEEKKVEETKVEK